MAARNVTTDCLDGPDHLVDLHPGRSLYGPRSRKLFFRHSSNIFGSLLDCLPKLRAGCFLSDSDFLLGDPDSGSSQVRVIEFLRIGEKRCVPVLAHGCDDSCSNRVDLGIVPRASCQQPLFRLRCKLQDLHHSTILFKGYSTIPSALAAFSFGRICRTTASSMMVLTATHSGSLNGEMVGFLSAGSTPRTPGKSSRCTLSSKPTLLAAAIAPCSIRIKLSAF